MSKQPFISVIVAVFNASDTLQQCIDSVANQTFTDKELIIIDGGSDLETLEIIKRNSDSIRYWISEPDSGIYSAWNKGLRQAKGEWICFLGADDFFFHSLVLEQMAARLVNVSAGINIVYAPIMLVNSTGETIHLYGNQPWEVLKPRFQKIMCLPHQGTFHRCRLFLKHGNFDESFKIAGDYEMLLRELKSADAKYIRDVVVAGMRQGGGISSQPGNAWLVLKEIWKVHRKHGRLYPTLLWIAAVIKLGVRTVLWKTLGEHLTRKLLDVGRRLTGQPSFWTKAR